MPGLGGPGAPGGAKAQVRPGGGFRPSFDSSLNEGHMDDAAMQASGQQKQASQQGSVLGRQGAAQQLAQQQGAGQTPLANPDKQTPAREVSDIQTEAKRFGKDIIDAGKSIFDVYQILNIKVEDSPEKKAKKEKIAQGWQKLTEKEQSFIQEQYQAEMKKKQAEEEEGEAKKKKEEEKKEESIVPPSSPQKGFGANKKQNAQTMMQRKRTNMTQADG